jgi:hypothetical protein
VQGLTTNPAINDLRNYQFSLVITKKGIALQTMLYPIYFDSNQFFNKHNLKQANLSNSPSSNYSLPLSISSGLKMN